MSIGANFFYIPLDCMPLAFKRRIFCGENYVLWRPRLDVVPSALRGKQQSCARTAQRPNAIRPRGGDTHKAATSNAGCV